MSCTQPAIHDQSEQDGTIYCWCCCSSTTGGKWPENSVNENRVRVEITPARSSMDVAQPKG